MCLACGARPSFAQPIAQEVRVNFLSRGEPDTIDPNRTTLAFAVEAALIRQIFEPLLRFDDGLVPRPAAAESYDVSPDGTVYTFNLRRDGRWSDGRPVVAAQFEYSWKRILDPTLNADYAPFFVAAGILGADDFHSGRAPNPDNVGVRALDDYTLEIRLSQPFGPLPNLAALWVVSPLRPDVVSANLDGWAQNPASYIGNGAFMLSEWVHQDHITLVQNPNYAAHSAWPRPTLTRVTVHMVPSADADYAAFKNDERDWTLVPDVEVSQVLNDPEQAAQARPYTDLTTFWVHVNGARPPLDNVNVRRSLAKALDRKALVRDIANTISVPTTSIIPPGMPGHQADLGQELSFDVDGARALLTQAGFPGPNAQGFPKLAFSFPNTPANQRRADYLQARWRQNLGLDIQLKPLDQRAYQQALTNRDYDLAFGGWAAEYPDPQDWFRAAFGCQAGFNYYNYCNPTFDQTVARGDTATVLNDRLVQYDQAQSMLIRDVPVVPLYVRGRLALVKPWVQSIDGGPLPVSPLDEYPGSLFLDRVQIVAH
jgi:oligopeptide transport system substrate-binding protein